MLHTKLVPFDATTVKAGQTIVRITNVGSIRVQFVCICNDYIFGLRGTGYDPQSKLGWACHKDQWQNIWMEVEVKETKKYVGIFSYQKEYHPRPFAGAIMDSPSDVSPKHGGIVELTYHGDELVEAKLYKE